MRHPHNYISHVNVSVYVAVCLLAYVLESQQRAIERRPLREAEIVGGADQLVSGRDLDDGGHRVEMSAEGKHRRKRAGASTRQIGRFDCVLVHRR